jgi:hypothetical protein
MIGRNFAAVVVGTNIAKDKGGNRCIGLRFGTGGGDAVLQSLDGASVTLKNISNGETFACSVAQVVSVTSTVADIVAIYEK